MNETGGPEHDGEPVPGLPARLPQGEHIVWQGAPVASIVLRRLLRARLVGIAFAAMAAWSVALGVNAGEGAALLGARLLYAAAGAAMVLGLMALYARLVARTSLYTITNKRIVMRIGIAISASFNLPYAQISEAGFRSAEDGSGDIALGLAKGHGLSSAVFFPHQKGGIWRALEPQLICLADVRAVAALLAKEMQAHDPAFEAPATAPAARHAAQGSAAASRARRGPPSLMPAE
jgi:hypothetical protein